jgi:hypothetical protein
MLATLLANKFEIVCALLAVSEALALIPSLKANSILGLITGALAKVKALIAPAQIK